MCKFKNILDFLIQRKEDDKVKKLTMNDCSKRKLDDTYLVIYAIRNEINIKKGEYIEKEDIYTLVGIDKKGFRTLINIYPDRKNNNRYWLDIFENLKARGIKNVLFISIDNNKNFKRAAKVAFPKVAFIDSLTDIMPRFYKFSYEKNAKEIGSRLCELYVQKTTSDYKDVFNKFKQRYNNVIHQKLIEKYLNNVESLYKYSVNIRKFLFRHSANIYLYDRIRLNFNSQKSYIGSLDEIYEKLGNMDDYFGFSSFKKNEWILMLNDIIQLYPDLELI